VQQLENSARVQCSARTWPRATATHLDSMCIKTTFTSVFSSRQSCRSARESAMPFRLRTCAQYLFIFEKLTLWLKQYCRIWVKRWFYLGLFLMYKNITFDFAPLSCQHSADFHVTVRGGGTVVAAWAQTHPKFFSGGPGPPHSEFCLNRFTQHN